MKNVEVYNRGGGWRIDFPAGNLTYVLTVEEARDWRDALDSALLYVEAQSPNKRMKLTVIFAGGSSEA